MPLTPIDVQQKTFGPELRGYNMDEVDDFLDEVVATLKDYDQRIRDAQDRIRALEAEVASRGEDETAISRALVAAQKHADSVVADAELDAERIRQQAHGESDQLRSDRDTERMALTQEIARMRATVGDLKRRIVDLAASAENELDSMDAAIADAATTIDGTFHEEDQVADAGYVPVEENAAAIGDWGESSEDFEPSSEVGWEGDVAADATEDEGVWTETDWEDEEALEADDPADAPEAEDVDVVEAIESTEEVEVEVVEVEETAEPGYDDEDQRQPGEIGTLADRMAREAAATPEEPAEEGRASGRRPWERGSV